MPLLDFFFFFNLNVAIWICHYWKHSLSYLSSNEFQLTVADNDELTDDFILALGESQYCQFVLDCWSWIPILRCHSIRTIYRAWSYSWLYIGAIHKPGFHSKYACGAWLEIMMYNKFGGLQETFIHLLWSASVVRPFMPFIRWMVLLKVFKNVSKYIGILPPSFWKTFSDGSQNK